MWGLQGQDCAFLGAMRPSDAALVVRMPAMLMQLCTIVVRDGGLGRSIDLVVEAQEMLLSWQTASASEVLAADWTCKPQAVHLSFSPHSLH